MENPTQAQPYVSSKHIFICKCPCGKKIGLDSTSKVPSHIEYSNRILKTFGVATLEELSKIYRCRTCRKRGFTTTPSQNPSVSSIPNFHGLVGYEKTIEDINMLQKFGSKAIFMGGYHGLGKSSIVEALAKDNGAELVRFQITELTSEVDILGGLDIKSGEFTYSNFTKALISANEDSSKLYYVLLDEFTRGRDEALNVLFPLLAEKKLIINSPYAKDREIKLANNVKIFATGNLHDTGQREVGQAELDRYNVIEIKPILDADTLNHIVGLKVGTINSETRDMIVKLYINSWNFYKEGRILAMSIRTLIECCNIAKEFNKKLSSKSAVRKALELTYYGTSHAILNPNYARTYQEMVRELV